MELVTLEAVPILIKAGSGGRNCGRFMCHLRLVFSLRRPLTMDCLLVLIRNIAILSNRMFVNYVGNMLKMFTMLWWLVRMLWLCDRL